MPTIDHPQTRFRQSLVDFLAAYGPATQGEIVQASYNFKTAKGKRPPNRRSRESLVSFHLAWLGQHKVIRKRGEKFEVRE